MKKILLALLALASPLFGSDLIVKNYDVDSLSYYYPILCTPTVGTGPGQCPGSGYSDSRKITTAGVSTTTVTSVSSNGAFSLAAAGDVIVISPESSGVLVPTMRQITAKASADSVTLDSAVTIASTGTTFRFWHTYDAAGAEDGWFATGGIIADNALIDISQISVTGGIDYKLECRHGLQGGGYSLPFSVVATTNKTAVSVSQAAWSLSGTAQGPWDQCRVGLKVGTADDDVITIGGSSDNIDWKEYVNSYTVAASNDLDFVEDTGGTPITCNADVAAGTYTGAALATLITTEMNDDVANCTGTLNNTYTATYSTTTHKFTIARTTGTATIDLLWATGTNTATSMKTILGYSNADDTAGTSYASDSATGESAEINTVLDAGIYATGALACAEVEAEMQGDATAATIDCTYNADDTISISATGITQLMILWNSGTNNATSADQHLGFSADSTGALTYDGAAIGMNASNEVEKVTITVAGYK